MSHPDHWHTTIGGDTACHSGPGAAATAVKAAALSTGNGQYWRNLTADDLHRAERHLGQWEQEIGGVRVEAFRAPWCAARPARTIR